MQNIYIIPLCVIYNTNEEKEKEKEKIVLYNIYLINKSNLD